MSKNNYLSINDLFKFLEGDNSHKKLRVCIATEDIVGPISNGGIGTTYFDLAKLLAERGYDITIAYLRGEHCEHESIDFWIKFYEQMNIKFIPIKLLNNFENKIDRWASPMYALMKFLEINSFDVLHVSEWRGSSYFVTLSKKLLVNFNNLLILVKSSSPWVWNRENQGELISPIDSFKIFTEKKSIEYSDLTIGGSAYLLNWMEEHGYYINKNKTIVLQNVVLEDKKIVKKNFIENKKAIELVFFGRLEFRKGIHLFCEAIEQIDDLADVTKITFLGKLGGELPINFKIRNILNYIKEFNNKINIKFNHRVKVEIIKDYQKIEAINYLLKPGILAIMPSIAENSSLTLYECLIYGIPFIATDVGGNTELIKTHDIKSVICQPNSKSLNKLLIKKISTELTLASPSKDNSKILSDWELFHSKLNNYFHSLGNIKQNDLIIDTKKIIFKQIEHKTRLDLVLLNFGDCNFDSQEIDELNKIYNVYIYKIINYKKDTDNLKYIESIIIDEFDKANSINLINEKLKSHKENSILLLINSLVESISFDTSYFKKLMNYFLDENFNNSFIIPSFLNIDDSKIYFQKPLDLNSPLYSLENDVPNIIIINNKNFLNTNYLEFNFNTIYINNFIYLYFNILNNNFEQLPTPFPLFNLKIKSFKNFKNFKNIEILYLSKIFYNKTRNYLLYKIFLNQLSSLKSNTNLFTSIEDYNKLKYELNWKTKKFFQLKGDLNWSRKMIWNQKKIINLYKYTSPFYYFKLIKNLFR